MAIILARSTDPSNTSQRAINSGKFIDPNGFITDNWRTYDQVGKTFNTKPDELNVISNFNTHILISKN